MKKKFTLLMASMMLLGASAAQAWTDAGCCYEDLCCEDQTGFYIGAFGGANFISTSKECRNGSSGSRRSFDTGYVVAGSIGYRWCHNVRFEFEYSYRNNKVSHKFGSSNEAVVAIDAGCESGSGRKSRNFYQNAYMFNGFYDISFCNDWCVKPYIGAGIGYAQTRNANEPNIDIDVPSSYASKNKRNGFAWQIIAGLAYPICDEVDLSLEYRFFKSRERNIYNNDIGLGLKYYF